MVESVVVSSGVFEAMRQPRLNDLLIRFLHKARSVGLNSCENWQTLFSETERGKFLFGCIIDKGYIVQYPFHWYTSLLLLAYSSTVVLEGQ